MVECQVAWIWTRDGCHSRLLSLTIADISAAVGLFQGGVGRRGLFCGRGQGKTVAWLRSLK